MVRRLRLTALLLALALPGRAKDGDPYGGMVSDEFLDKIMDRKAPGAPATPPEPGAAPGSAEPGVGASAPGGADLGSGAPAPSAAAAQASAAGAARTRGASQNAVRAAEALKKMGMGEPGALEAAGGATGQAAGGSAHGRDFLVAAASGQGAVFKDMGLTAGVGADGQVAIVDSAGRPASAAQIALLKERLASEPAALMRRPDFYQVLPRERFQELKTDYRGRPNLSDTAFKHMGLSAGDRDFQWSQSCQKLSGRCNPAESAAHYQKGADVAPETLKKTWRTIHESDAAEDEEDDDIEEKLYALRTRNLAASRAKTRSSGLGAAFAGIRARLSGLFWRSADDAQMEARGAVSHPRPGDPPQADAPDGEARTERRVDAGTSRAPLAPGLKPPSPLVEPRQDGRFQTALAAGAFGSAVVLFWFYRRETES